MLAALIIAIAACTPAALPPIEAEVPCALTLVALPRGASIDEDDPLPAVSRMIAAPQDFDIASTTIEDDGLGDRVVNLRLRGAAVEAFTAHTADHIGDQIALLIDGVVVSVPVILARIEGGQISVRASDAEVDRFADCVRP